jgi:hypothetical protein
MLDDGRPEIAGGPQADADGEFLLPRDESRHEEVLQRIVFLLGLLVWLVLASVTWFLINR